MNSNLSLHSLNQSFHWRNRSGSLRRLSEEQRQHFNEQGFLVIPDAFDPSALQPLIRDLDAAEEGVDAFLRTQPDGKLFIARADDITFTTHLVTRSERAREFTHSAFFQDTVYDLMGEDVRLYWDQAVYKKPETDQPFPWHQDNGYTFVEPQQYLTCWVALTEATVESGCPWVVPGVHLNGTLRHEMTDLGWECFSDPPRQAVAAPVPAGGVVVFSSLTPHKTGPNLTSDHVRKAYIIQFAPEGAALIQDQGGGTNRSLCNVPERQYWILKGGLPVSD
ncbi:MAG: phytanoyl-CoA dioxygenase family protein [Myxococcota bacterium]|nr:phytanoyl-CoA dioxygenase family protein [Myxococcota bacterium]